MRTTLRCPKCSHREILKAPLLDQAGSHGTQQAIAAVVPTKVLGGLITDPRPVGKLDAYICRGCGYTELYVADPDAIPDSAFRVEVLRGGDDEGPYRS